MTEKKTRTKKAATAYKVDVNGRSMGAKEDFNGSIDGDICIVFNKNVSRNQLRKALSLAAVRIK